MAVLLVYKRLKEIGFYVIKPIGVFYIMSSIKRFKMTGQVFSTKIKKEKSVAIVPGDIFGSYSSNKLRISYAIQMELYRYAIERIENFINTL